LFQNRKRRGRENTKTRAMARAAKNISFVLKNQKKSAHIRLLRQKANYWAFD
jgi:hypothetical protein